MKTARTSLFCVVALSLLGMNTVRLRGQTGTTGAMEEHAHAPAPLSTSLTLTIDGKATTLSVAELQVMPQTTVKVHKRAYKDG